MQDAKDKLNPLFLDILNTSPAASDPPKPKRGRPKAVNITRGHELEDRADALADEVTSLPFSLPPLPMRLLTRFGVTVSRVKHW